MNLKPFRPCVNLGPWGHVVYRIGPQTAVVLRDAPQTPQVRRHSKVSTFYHRVPIKGQFLFLCQQGSPLNLFLVCWLAGCGAPSGLFIGFSNG